MKPLCTLSLAVCVSVSAMAQSKHTPGHQFFKPNAHQRQIANMLLMQQMPTAQKTTALTERVIAESYYEQSLVDSIIYHYPGQNPSHYNYLLLYYNSEYNPTVNASINYLNLTPKPEMLYDTMTYLTDNGSGLALVQTQAATYDAAYNRTNFTEYFYTSGSVGNGNRYINIYTGGNLTESTWMVWDAGTMSWNDQAKRYTTYNAQGMRLKDSLVDVTASPTPVQNNLYTYDASGRLAKLEFTDGVSASVMQDMQFEYYSNGLTKRIIQHIDFGAGLIAAVRDTFAYSGSKNHCSLWREYQYNTMTGQFQGIIEFKKHINAQGLPDTSIISQDNLGTWEPLAMGYTVFNSFDNPVRTEQYTYSGGVPVATPDAIGYYYYEQYNNTAVKNVAATQANMIAYPNPATGTLNLTWKDAKAGERISIQLLNAVGQLVYSESLNWQQPTEQLQIGNLPTGTYRLVVSDKTGAAIYQQAVVKQ